MDRNTQKNALINLALALVAAAGCYALSRAASLLTGQVAAFFFVLAALVSLVSWFHMGLEERERLEKLEFDEVTKIGSSSTLFNTQEAEAFPARRSREQFEKYFVPGFAVILLLLQVAGAWRIWEWLSQVVVTPPKHLLVVVGFNAAAFLILFVVGQYSWKLVRIEKLRLLEPSANYTLLSAYLTAIVAGVAVAVLSEFPRVDRIVASVLCVVLGVLAVENLLSLIFEVYRPRLKGRTGRVLYDSRLTGLIGHPEGLFTTAAHALDYQFGFKVSETWFFRLMQRAFAWLVLLQVAVLMLSTCVVFVGAGEQALLERFGQLVPGREVLGPGAHVKWPWPVEIAYPHQTDQIQTFAVGFVPEADAHANRATLWTVAHQKEEFDLLVATKEAPDQAPTTPGATRKSPPVNLLTVSIPIHYQVGNLQAWAYGYKGASNLLEQIANREVVKYLVHADLQEIMSRGRQDAAQALQDRIQGEADKLGLGVKIIFVGLQGIHPPIKVAGAYEQVAAASQTRAAMILNAQAEGIATNAFAKGEALRIVREAEADSRRSSLGVVARAVNFTNQIPAFLAAPDVYRTRAYLQTLAHSSTNARKIILARTNNQDLIQVDLQEKIRRDMGTIRMRGTGAN